MSRAFIDNAHKRITHLGIGAHADDLEILAFHGISECYDHDDKWFMGITVCDGAGSSRTGRFAKVTDAEMVKIRHEEQLRAAQIGRYGLQVQLGLSSQTVKSRDPIVTEKLIEHLRQVQPEVIYTHCLSDKHDTHVALCLSVIETLRTLKYKPKRFYGCEVWRDLDWLPDDVKIALPVSKHEDLALQLCTVFESQIEGGKRYDLGTLGRRRAHATFSEANTTDSETGLILAMDLLPLLHDPKLSPRDYVSSLVDKLKTDVVDRLKRLKS